mmetsp:Transcript_18989/g.33752  ORF Transcript_18989/g.33752 Transcript_18989/m.33752 type:complete len:422 (-) Transcript_18989:93-1358(-)
MSSGLLQQIQARGVQDKKLSVNPDASFFKRKYKKITNYAIESIDTPILSLAWGKDYVVNVPRSGDLLMHMWLVVDVDRCRLETPGEDGVYWTNTLGHAMIKSAKLTAGQNVIQQLTGLFMEIKWELSSKSDVDTDRLVLRSTNPTQLMNWTQNGNTFDADGNEITRLYVKLPFYFSEAPSQALPTIAVQFSNLYVNLSLRSKADLLCYTNPENKQLSATEAGEIRSGVIMSDFAYLESFERQLFVQKSHEYVIRDVQISDFHTKASAGNHVSARVTFNHPTTAFYWVVQRQALLDAKDYFNFERTDGRGDDTITTATIKFNGAERERPRDPLYFGTIQPAKFFNRTPRKNIYVYSTSMYPLEWFPSGSVNLSRIDTTTLEFSLPRTNADGEPFGEANITIMAENHNFLRVQAGIVHVRFST